MSKTFLISDTHFFHDNILKFKREDGSPLRNFKDMDHMMTTLIYNWNKVVGKGDKVYHLGDVGFSNASSLQVLDQLNGTKVLIKGNHDGQKLSVYAQYFKDVRAYHILDKFLLSHIPIHPESLSRWKANIHGHTHANLIEDPRYYNVSVEVINYTPVDFEEIRSYYGR